MISCLARSFNHQDEKENKQKCGTGGNSDGDSGSGTGDESGTSTKPNQEHHYVNIKYIRNLHNVDDNVPSVSPQIGKQARPFLGIVALVNGSKFCIPFTSNSGA